MAQAQTFSTDFKSSSTNISGTLEKYNFDNNLINKIEDISEESDKVIDEYLTEEEALKIKIIPIEQEEPTFKNTTNLNDLLLNIIRTQGNMPPDPDDDSDDKKIKREKEKELLKYINFVDYANIERTKIKNEYNKYATFKLKLEKIKQNKANFEEMEKKSKNWIVSFINLKNVFILTSTGVAVAVSLCVTANLANPGVWIGYFLKVYDNPVLFSMFNDLMTMLGIFNVAEKFSFKTLFDKLQVAIKVGSSPIDANGQPKERSQIIPYGDKDFIQFVLDFLSDKYKNIPKVGDPNYDNGKLQKEVTDIITKFGIFLDVENGEIKDIKNIPELKGLFQFLKTILDKKNIPFIGPAIELVKNPFNIPNNFSSEWLGIDLQSIPYFIPPELGTAAPETGTAAPETGTAAPEATSFIDIGTRIASLLLDAKNLPYINSLVTTFELGKVITGYVETTYDVISKTPDINSTFLYKSIANGLIYSDTAKCLSFLSSKGIKNESLQIFNAVFGEQLLQNGANALQSIPFIGGVFTGNNLEAVFITSVNNLIISQISGTVNGYFQQIEDETKIKTPASANDDDSKKKKKDVVTEIEENIKLRVKYKNEGFTNEEISEILEQGEIDPEKEYQTIIGKGINSIYKKFNQYKKKPVLILQALCNTIFTFNTLRLLFFSSLTGLIFNIIQDYIYHGTIHKKRGIDPLTFTLSGVIGLIIQILYGGDFQLKKDLRLLQTKWIKTVLHDLNLFINDVIRVCNDKMLSKMSINKYIQKFTNHWTGKLFNQCISLTYNILIIPSIQLELTKFTEHGIFETNIIQLLTTDKEQCSRFFLFVNHKLNNIFISLTRGEVLKIIKDTFLEIADINKILYNYVVPYYDLTTGYYKWDPCNLNNLQGSVLTLTKPAPQTSGPQISGAQILAPPSTSEIIIDNDLEKNTFTLLDMDTIGMKFKTEFVEQYDDFQYEHSVSQWSLFTSTTSTNKTNLFKCDSILVPCTNEENLINAFFFYYYDEFIHSTPPPSKNTYSAFQKWLIRTKLEMIRNKVKNPIPPAIKPNPRDIFELAMINKIAVIKESLIKESGVSAFLFSRTPSDFELGKSVLKPVPTQGSTPPGTPVDNRDIFDSFLNGFDTLFIDDKHTVSQNQLLSTISDEIILPVPYSSIFSTIYTPTTFKTIDFFSIPQLLKQMSQDDNILSLNTKIDELENKAKTDTSLKYKLSIFNNAQKKFLTMISKVVIAFTNRFNTNFNNSLENISLSYIGFNFNLFYKICESFTNNNNQNILDILDKYTNVKDTFISKQIIISSGIKNICKDTTGNIINLLYDNNIDADTMKQVNCPTPIEKLDITNLDKSLFFKLLFRPDTITRLYELRGNTIIDKFLDDLNPIYENLFDIVDNCNQDTLINKFNLVGNLMDLIKKNHKNVIDKIEKMDLNVIKNYIKNISGIEYKCFDTNGQIVFLDKDKKNIDTGNIIENCYDDKRNYLNVNPEQINWEQDINILNIILRPNIIKMIINNPIPPLVMSENDMDTLNNFRNEIKGIGANFDVYMNSIKEKLFDTFKDSEQYKKLDVFEKQKIQTFISFARMFNLINKKSKLDFSIKETLNTYFLNNINTSLDKSSIVNSEIEKIDDLCSKGTIVSIKAFIENTNFNNWVQIGDRANPDSFYMQIPKKFEEENKAIYDNYNIQKAKMINLKNRIAKSSNLLNAIDINTICEPDGDFATYQKELKEWIKLQEQMYQSIVMFTAKKHYDDYINNIITNDSNILSFYNTYTDGISNLYEQYVQKGKNMLEQLNVLNFFSKVSSETSTIEAEQNKPKPIIRQGGPGLETKPPTNIEGPPKEIALNANQVAEAQVNALKNELETGTKIDEQTVEAQQTDEAVEQSLSESLASALGNLFGGLSSLLSSLLTTKPGGNREDIVGNIKEYIEPPIEKLSQNDIKEKCKTYDSWYWQKDITTGKLEIKELYKNRYKPDELAFIRQNCSQPSAFFNIAETFSITVIDITRTLCTIPGLIGTYLLTLPGVWIKGIGFALQSISGLLTANPHCIMYYFHALFAKAFDMSLRNQNNPLTTGDKLLIVFWAYWYSAQQKIEAERGYTRGICNALLKVSFFGDEQADEIPKKLDILLKKALPTKDKNGKDIYLDKNDERNILDFNIYGNIDVGTTTEAYAANIGKASISMLNFLNENEKNDYTAFKQHTQTLSNGVLSDCTYFNNNTNVNFLKILVFDVCTTGNPSYFLNYLFCSFIGEPYFDFFQLTKDIASLMTSIPKLAWNIVVGIGYCLLHILTDPYCIPNLFKKIWDDFKNIIFTGGKLGKYLTYITLNSIKIVNIFSDFIEILVLNKDLRNLFLDPLFGMKSDANKKRYNPLRDIIDESLENFSDDLIKKEEKWETEQDKEFLAEEARVNKLTPSQKESECKEYEKSKNRGYIPPTFSSDYEISNIDTTTGSMDITFDDTLFDEPKKFAKRIFIVKYCIIKKLQNEKTGTTVGLGGTPKYTPTEIAAMQNWLNTTYLPKLLTRNKDGKLTENDFINSRNKNGRQALLKKDIRDVFLWFGKDLIKAFWKIISNWSAAPPANDLKVYTDFKNCRDSRSCHIDDLLNSLIQEFEEKIIILDVDNKNDSTNIVYELQSTTNKQIFDNLKTAFSTYQGETDMIKKEAALAELLIKLKEFKTNILDTYVAYKDVYCKIKLNTANPTPTGSIFPAIDLVLNEKQFGMLTTNTMECDEIANKIDLYISEIGKVVEYYIGMSELDIEIKKLIISRLSQNEDSSIYQYIINNVRNNIRNDISGITNIDLNKYMFLPCGDDEILVLNKYVPSCIKKFDVSQDDKEVTDIKDQNSILSQNKLEFIKKRENILRGKIENNLKEILPKQLYEIHEKYDDDTNFFNDIASIIYEEIKRGTHNVHESEKIFYDMLEIKNTRTKTNLSLRVTELEKQLEEAEKSLRLNDVEIINDELQNVKNKLIYLNKTPNDFDNLINKFKSKEKIKHFNNCKTGDKFCDTFKDITEAVKNINKNFISEELTRIKRESEISHIPISEPYLETLYLEYFGLYLTDGKISLDDSEAVYTIYKKFEDSLKPDEEGKYNFKGLEIPDTADSKFELLNSNISNREFRKKIAHYLYDILEKDGNLNKFYSKQAFVLDRTDKYININGKVYDRTSNVDLRRQFYESLQPLAPGEKYEDHFLTIDQYGLFVQTTKQSLSIQSTNVKLAEEDTSVKKGVKSLWENLYYASEQIVNLFSGLGLWDKITIYTDLAQKNSFETKNEAEIRAINDRQYLDPQGNILEIQDYNSQNKFSGIPPSILYNYKDGADTVQNDFVKKYYKPFYIDTNGVLHEQPPANLVYTYHLSKAEISYYEKTFANFDAKEFIKRDVHECNPQILNMRIKNYTPEEDKKYANDFLSFIIINAETYNFNGIPKITSVDPNKMVNQFIQDLVNLKGTIKNMEELKRKLELIGVDNLNTIYKFWLITNTQKKINYLSTLEIKGVSNKPLIYQESFDPLTNTAIIRENKLNTIDALQNLPEISGLENLYNFFPTTLYNIKNQLNVVYDTITGNASFIFDTKNMVPLFDR